MARGLGGSIKGKGTLSLSLAEFGKVERRGRENRWREGRAMIMPDQPCGEESQGAGLSQML